ncbi:NUDIX hydrolase [Sediminibacillus massiliensis]|uniref:NUDIX hydrolase n=1 Tax=Sediminibacillus massiliensis TaxID=1926277 RepID=UPI00098894C5|nr:NUDIX hydrolase [Sediminibacillus massiliensis]
MKKLSAGLILTDGEKFLGCHSTGNWFYDLPKGEIDSQESPEQTCIRETREETGLDISKEKLFDLGIFDYNPKKDLHLFLLRVEQLPDITLMNCFSCFIHPLTKKETKEVDGYKYIPFETVESFMTKNMVKVIRRIIDGKISNTSLD